MNKITIRNGFFSFLIVLLLMPIGHALMILNEEFLEDHKYYGAFIMGVIGVGMLAWGVKKSANPVFSTLMGFVGAILVWTGWVEFSFVWIAEKNNVEHFYADGEIATKREYLIMLSSIGLLLTISSIYLFIRTNCTFFIWFQKVLGLQKDIQYQTKGFKKPVAASTFNETIMILWFFYILLLVVYDDQIAGDYHPATYITAFGSLVWSIFLVSRLIKKSSFDYAIRYAIPTVIIFWNFVEVIGRWGLFKEIWVHPQEYWLEVSAFFILFFILFFAFIKLPNFNRKYKLKD